MRRATILMTVMALAGSMFAMQPAQAHFSFYIAGTQYFYTSDLSAGLATYLGVPGVGPVAVAATPTDDGFVEVVNYDPLPHTFTRCESGCDTTYPEWDLSIDYALAPNGGRASLAALDGTYFGTLTFGCRLHNWMRGEVRLI